MPPTHSAIATRNDREISQLLVRWGDALDSGDWEKLSRCFHEDATIHLSCFTGRASGFVARARAIAATRTPRTHMKHVTWGFWIELEGNRAFCRSHVSVHARSRTDAHEVELQSWFRFFDQLEQRGGIWGICRRTAVYDRTGIEAVAPRVLEVHRLAAQQLSEEGKAWLGKR